MMNRFFLTLIVIVFYSFSSDLSDIYKKVGDMVNYGREIEDEKTCKEFETVLENYEGNMLCPFIQVSLGKYKLVTGYPEVAAQYFFQVLELYNETEDLEILYSFPDIVRDSLKKESKTIKSKKEMQAFLQKLYPKR